MKKIQSLVTLSVLSLPSLAFAQQLSGTRRFIESVGDIIKLLITVVLGIALLVFFWGLAKFILKAGDAKEVENGRRLMVWGIIAIFVMVSVWGIIYFIQGELGISRSNTPGGVPGTIPYQSGFPSQLPGQPVQLQPPSGNR